MDNSFDLSQLHPQGNPMDSGLLQKSPFMLGMDNIQYQADEQEQIKRSQIGILEGLFTKYYPQMSDREKLRRAMGLQMRLYQQDIDMTQSEKMKQTQQQQTY